MERAQDSSRYEGRSFLEWVGFTIDMSGVKLREFLRIIICNGQLIRTITSRGSKQKTGGSQLFPRKMIFFKTAPTLTVNHLD